MSKSAKFILLAIALLAAIYAVGRFPIQQEDNQTRQARERLRSIVEVGQNLNYAEQILMDAGFEMQYAKPIMPTANQDYLQQLVIVGPTQPNIFETIAYTTQIRWIPFTHSESPYVILNADLDGTITEVR